MQVAAGVKRDKGNELVNWFDLASHNNGSVKDGKHSS